MAQGCLKCLKYTMCLANFLIFLCGMAVLGLGAYLVNFSIPPLTPTLNQMNIPSLLLVCGTIITCMSFLGFLGALKENRCLLLTFFLVLFLLMLVELTAACLLLIYEDKIGKLIKEDLENGLKKVKTDNRNATSDWDLVQKKFQCCGVTNLTDWENAVPQSCCSSQPCGKPSDYWQQGCLTKLSDWFEGNYLAIGVSVIVLCIIEVLGMCFAMTLFCHISRSGLGYKL